MTNVANDRTPFVEKYAKQGILEKDTRDMQMKMHLQGMTGNTRTIIERPISTNLRPHRNSGRYTVSSTYRDVPPAPLSTNAKDPCKVFEHLMRKRKMKDDYRALTLSHRNSTTTDANGDPLDVCSDCPTQCAFNDETCSSTDDMAFHLAEQDAIVCYNHWKTGNLEACVKCGGGCLPGRRSDHESNCDGRLESEGWRADRYGEVPFPVRREPLPEAVPP